MQVTLDIPDAYAAGLAAAGQDPTRVALEALAIEGYRAGNLNESELRRMLGFAVRMQVHAFLKAHDVYLNFPEDFALQEIAASGLMSAQRQGAKQPA